MNRREIIQRTLDFSNPERVGRDFMDSDMVAGKAEISEGEWQRVSPDTEERVDAWGNVWQRLNDITKGEVVRGGLPNLDDVETFSIPDFTDPALYTKAKETFAANPDHWHVGHVHGFAFSMARKLRKLDQYFLDLMTEPEKISILHDRIDAAISDQIRMLADAGADCILFGEDWGTQKNLLISPKLWRQEYKPRFAKLFAEAHDSGMRVFMHSCGKITSVIPDLIEVGVDVLQFDQPTIHGLDTLADFQKDHKITYWCPVDIQAILPSGDYDRIKQGVTDMLDTLWQGRGGFIAKFYPDPVAINVNPAWQDYAGEEFIRFGAADRYIRV